MSRFLAVLFALCVLVSSTRAQSDRSPSSAQSAEETVRATIEALFYGMRAGDSTQVRAVFHENARLHTALGPSETGAVRSTPVDSFVAAVGRPHDQTWDERIWDVEVRVDGPLASAWVPYVFYLGDERSHCGVNAVQLVKTGDGWRIIQLTDTRRETCDVPPEVQK